VKTREEYEQEVDRPGKFEGEQPWAVYFWEATLDGSGEDVYDGGTLLTLLTVDEDDRKLFPELDDVQRVAVWESDSGFVYCREVPTDWQPDGVCYDDDSPFSEDDDADGEDEAGDDEG
jgi:hypothetical protein